MEQNSCNRYIASKIVFRFVSKMFHCSVLNRLDAISESKFPENLVEPPLYIRQKTCKPHVN